MKKIFLVLLLLIPTACSFQVKSNRYNLPVATLGKLYQSTIYLDKDIPRSIWVRIWPENTGLQWQFKQQDSKKEAEDNTGDILKISGTPMHGIPTYDNKNYILIYIYGYGHQNKYDNTLRFKNEYYIKLIPNKNKVAESAHSTL